MITNADITIYNKKIIKGQDKAEYNPVHIRGVHWYTDIKTEITEKGLVTANVFKIRIPVDADTGGKKYVDPETYAKLADVSESWTIENGDIFVRGIVSDDIVKASDILQKYKDISGKVLSWSNNIFGSLPHWRIGGA